jgi:benzoyl-CoA reductase/2-hydroxyglutaryl-CoA dehydratase subunit BcrC/BadD/HgdB
MSEHHAQMYEDLGMDVALHEQMVASIHDSFRRRVLSQSNRPEGMAYFDGLVEAAHGSRVQEILDHKAAGGAFIGTFCIYVPEEIAWALDVLPLPLCGGSGFSVPYAEQRFPRDICPLVKSTLGMAFSGCCPFGGIKDMAVGETTCDAKKKTWDVMASWGVNFHVLDVPQKKNARTEELWRAEVGQFRERLEELAGEALRAEALVDAVRLINRRRRALARLHAFRAEDRPPISGTDALVVTQGALVDDPQRFCDRLEALNAELDRRLDEGVSPVAEDAPRIMVGGSPAVMGNWKLHHLIESAGAAVVCDETCTGTRYFEHPVPEIEDDVEAQLAAIADRYLKIDCACFSPNSERIDNVVKLAEDYRVDGMIQYVLQYCHGYNVEAITVAEALKDAGVPGMTLVTDYSEEDTGQLRTRIEAFLEMDA